MKKKAEDEVVSWLQRLLRHSGGALIGDDAAVLPGSDLALTTDTQIEGTHFVSSLDPRVLARRLLAVNLSDLAAMGAKPRYALLALAAPPSFDHRRFFKSMEASVRREGVLLVGGDLAKSPYVHACMTLIGERQNRWIERSGARPGHVLWLGGTVGESAAGAALMARGANLVGTKVHLPEGFSELPKRLRSAAKKAVRRHLLPQPQLELGHFLSTCQEGAALDVSDGVARDLHRLCLASGVGAELRIEDLPAPKSFRKLCRQLDRRAVELQLGGGEDYVLLFTLPESVTPPPECHPVGRILDGKDIVGHLEGKRSPLPPSGWDHLTDS